MSNAWVTYLQALDNLEKSRLIQDKTPVRKYCCQRWLLRELLSGDGPASYQLVGGVMAYQG